MQLKKLSLSGFKSFANPTDLEFGTGITAVVGPNGSGKSNIVDAMLWALGERSHKALRGHAATDVIFSGSSGRKATNLAEVSLFFDNSDGSLPVKYAEVQVTRRLFRDGDGEYAINGGKCRLKDVSDLFLDTGVGPDAYCVISQGEIDAILSAKAEDRRGLIEGAAGVQKYHVRRTETRRRLDKVQADLTRVADIMSELDSQLGPLAAQAELALEYDNYVRRLRQLQLAVLARDYDTRIKRKANLEEGRTGGEKAVAEHRTEIENLERLEAISEKRLRELEVQVETLGAELTDVISRLKTAEGQIAVARERRRALTEQQEFQAREIGMLRARVTASQENLTKGRKELQEAQRSSSDLSGAAAEAEAKLGAANAKLSEATRELQRLQAQVIEVMRAGQQRREAAAGGRAESAALTNRQRDLEGLRQDLANQAGQTQTAQETASKALAELRQGLEKANAEVVARREAWNAAQVAQKAAVEAQNVLREQRAKIQSRLSALRELEQNLEGIQGGARSVLLAVQRGQLAAVYTPVADAIRAERELELAIEVALGGAVNNLICDSDQEAKDGIAYLKRQQGGRATFLPLSNMRPSGLNDRTLAVLSDPAVRGVASELVDCEAKFDRAVDYLLGRVLIVETLDDAVRLARRCEGGARLVTLEGEVVLPAGAMTGGQGKQKAGGLLARKRELDELEEQVSGFAEKMNAAVTAQQEAARKVEQEQESWRQAGEGSNDLRAQVARQEREVDHLEREGRRIKGQAEVVESQLRQVEGSLASKTTVLEEHDKAASDVEERAKELERQVARAQEIVTLRQTERENITTEVADVRAGYGANQERLSGMRKALAELERTIAESEGQIRQKQAQVERAAGEDAQIVQAESGLVAQLAELQSRRETLETQVGEARKERTASLEKLQGAANGLRQRRQALHEVEEELHRVEVRLASTDAEMAELERRFREEFQVEVAEALERREDIEQKQAALDEIEAISAKIGGLGDVNVGAVAQYEQVKERLDFLTTQRDDLDRSRDELDAIIAEIDGRVREQFLGTFHKVQIAFEEMFTKTFGGGKTQLSLTDPDNLLETGIDLRVQMPGKATQDITLLSGGERALTALSFMLALLKVKPSPFVVLDEVDAPLDQSNVGRFADLLREFAGTTQFIVITHNNGTMQAADVLYGITQQEPGISTMMSVRLVGEEDGTQVRDAKVAGVGAN